MAVESADVRSEGGKGRACRPFVSRYAVTIALFAVCTAMLVAVIVITGDVWTVVFDDAPGEVVYRLGGIVPAAFAWPADAWRIVASAFVHSSAGHYFGNMIVLVGACLGLEPLVGHARLVVLATASVLMGEMVGCWWFMEFEGGWVLTFGASSMAMGIAAAGLMIVLFHEEHAYVFEGIGSPTLCLAIVATAVSIFATPESLSSHLGGIAGGALAMLALPMRGMTTPAPVRAIATVLLAGAAVAFCLYAFA